MADFTSGGRYINHPAYPAAQWVSRNPLLLSGEIGMELHPVTGIPWRYKVGAGRWNDLPYQQDLYPYADFPTNIIGNASGNLLYTPLADILHKMMNPFAVPSIANMQLNVNGQGYQSSVTLEIGQTISSPVIVNVIPTLPGNLNPSSPYTITANGFFANEGAFTGIPASLTLTPLSPSSILEVLISINGNYPGSNITNILQTMLAVYPKILWGSSAALSLASTDWTSLEGYSNLVTKNYQQSFSFPNQDYLYIAIPRMLSPINLQFADISNPLVENFITFDYQGDQTINNGIGTYAYATYKSRYAMIVNPTIVQIREL